MTRLVAAIDCGTNSTRLLITDGTDDVVRRADITRLGAGVDKTRALSPEGMARTVAVLREYADLVRSHGVERTRVVATSAARDATNRAEFFAVASAALGGIATPELLSGDEEGRFAFAGATAGLDPADGPFCVVDIGGGSTEFIAGTDGVEGVISVDMGSVRITEAFLHSDPPRPDELANALAVVGDHLDDVVREVPGVAAARKLIGVAGTITTVAAIEIGLEPYDRDAIHHFVLTKAAAEDVFRTLATESLADRVHNPGLHPQRADVIVGGCCVLVGIMRRLGCEELTVSESDILDGIAASLLT
ncbi:MAG: exopolyphosphatase [Acidimicrobiia bacterium]